LQPCRTAQVDSRCGAVATAFYVRHRARYCYVAGRITRRVLRRIAS
jgi:hypothetical protein